MFTPIIKDFGEVWNRLFDHRPFTNGEIKYFLREFEEKRHYQEETKLQNILEKVTDIRDKKLPKALSNVNQLEKLGTLLDIALQNCNTILENEDVASEEVQLIQEKRITREAEFQKFKEEVNAEYMKRFVQSTQPPQN